MKMRSLLKVVSTSLCCSAIAGCSAPDTSKLDAEAKAYGEKVVPKLVDGWSAAELKKEATPKLLTDMKEKQEFVDSTFADCSSKLGALKSITRTTISRNHLVHWLMQGDVYEAQCESEDVFEKGTATVAIGIYHSARGWQITGFAVENAKANDVPTAEKSTKLK